MPHATYFTDSNYHVQAGHISLMSLLTFPFLKQKMSSVAIGMMFQLYVPPCYIQCNYFLLTIFSIVTRTPSPGKGGRKQSLTLLLQTSKSFIFSSLLRQSMCKSSRVLQTLPGFSCSVLHARLVVHVIVACNFWHVHNAPGLHYPFGRKGKPLKLRW